MHRLFHLIPCALLLAASVTAQPKPPQAPPPPKPTAEPVPLPGGEGGIGLDDLSYSPMLDRVLIPAGGTGKLQLVNPMTRKMEEVGGFQSAAPSGEGHGHGAGTTSAEEGNGWIFAIDRSALRLNVIDPKKKIMVGGTGLAGSPDYVRYVAATHEVWVTEPDKDGIEIFSLSAANPPVPAHAAFLSIPGGPEALVIDKAEKRAFANLWKSSTVVIDLATRKVTQTWPNGCEGSRGLAMDPLRHLLFVGCAEGGADTLDLAKNGAVKDRFRFGAGTDIVAYNAGLQHLYVPASKTGEMAIVKVYDDGRMTQIATVATAVGAHCAVADDHRQVWICDPKAGRVLVVKDSRP
jgi:hypothetical protein